MELKFKTVAYQVDVPGVCSYLIERCFDDTWELECILFERFHITAADADGNALGWPSAEMAQLAAQQHYERMRVNGETPDVAASRIPTDPAWYEAKMGGDP